MDRSSSADSVKVKPSLGQAATVVSADVEACKSILHVIDKVRARLLERHVGMVTRHMYDYLEHSSPNGPNSVVYSLLVCYLLQWYATC